MNIPKLHQLFLSSKGICTDTRKIEKNTLFFALRGERFDGNTYAKKAIEQGVSYTIIDNKTFAASEQHILVDNVLHTLQKLATYHRQYLGIPIIALTGSNGKTTTKELIYNVLSSTFITVATIGNLNNHIGVPLTLLSMTKDTEIGIVEMGANHLEEIEFLSAIAMPDYGYITNIGKAHLEGFGSLEGVLQGKTELYTHLQQHNKLVFLNNDDPLLRKAATGIQTYTFSQQSNSDSEVYITLIDANPMVRASFENTRIQSNLIGVYNFTNIAAAIAIGNYFKIKPNVIKKAIESYHAENNRSQIIKKENTTIILDAYNANPSSMTAAITNFDQLNYTTKAVFLGDMFELGEDTAIEHQKIADLIISIAVDAVYLIGENFYNISSNDDKIVRYKNFEDFATHWNPQNYDAILIKGSRGMQLERILKLI